MHVEADVGRDVLTDIDVLAIDIDLRLRLTRSILECKTGQGQAGEPDRLLWLAGLRDYVDATRAVLVRGTVNRRGRAIAGQLGVEVIDTSKLDAREGAHAWLPEAFAHLGGAGCTDAESRTNTQLKALGHLPPDLVGFLRYGALIAPPHRVLAALTSLGDAKAAPLPEPTGTVLAGYSLIALLVAAITDAQSLDVLAVDQVRRRVELALTVGDPDDQHVLEVLNVADQLVDHLIERIHERYVAAGAGRQRVDLPSLRQVVAEPPAWVPRYLDLLEALRANPAIGRDLPQTAELACFDALLGDKAYLSTAFDHLFTAEHRQLTRLAVRTLREIVGSGIADRLGGLSQLNFERTPPSLPDRRGTTTGGQAAVPPTLASEASSAGAEPP